MSVTKRLNEGFRLRKLDKVIASMQLNFALTITSLNVQLT